MTGIFTLSDDRFHIRLDLDHLSDVVYVDIWRTLSRSRFMTYYDARFAKRRDIKIIFSSRKVNI